MKTYAFAGSGYSIWSQSQCNSDNPSTGCEQSGSMYYPKCMAGFHAVGCCVCSPDCPSGWGDTGTRLHQADFHGGACTPISVCAARTSQSGLLCYGVCQSGYTGSGALAPSPAPRPSLPTVELAAPTAISPPAPRRDTARRAQPTISARAHLGCAGSRSAGRSSPSACRDIFRRSRRTPGRRA